MNVSTRLIAGTLLLGGVTVSALTTGRGSPWTRGPDAQDALDLAGRGTGWGLTVVAAVAGTWLAAWVAVAVLPRQTAGRALVTACYLLPAGLLAADALATGGQDAVVALLWLAVLWPAPLLLLWTGRRALSARIAVALALVGLLGHSVVVARLVATGEPTGRLWLATGGVLAVATGAALVVRRTRTGVSPARRG